LTSDVAGDPKVRTRFSRGRRSVVSQATSRRSSIGATGVDCHGWRELFEADNFGKTRRSILISATGTSLHLFLTRPWAFPPPFNFHRGPNMRNPSIRSRVFRQVRGLSPLLLLTLVAASAGTVEAQSSWTERQKLTADDAVAGIGFGDAVALTEFGAYVGATANGLANLSPGAVYVLALNSETGIWEHWQKVVANDGALDDRFGWSVDVSVVALIVGAPDDDDGGNLSGSAYIFEFDGDSFVQVSKLVASDASASDHFGRSVAIYEDVAVVGAPDADGSGGPTGAAYVYRRNGGTWQQEQKLQVGTFATIAGFGAAVSITADRIMVGVPRSGPGAQNLGSAYSFVYDSDQSQWVEEGVLSASDEDSQDMFGSSLDLFGDLALIGVPQDEDVAAFAGAAYVFRWDGNAWQEEQKLTADDGAEDDRFGSKVSIYGGVAVVGSPFHAHEAMGGAGAVYVYEYDSDAGTWSQSQKLEAGDPGIGDHFGEAVATYDGNILVGASNNDDGGESAGSAYYFKTGGTGTAVEELPGDIGGPSLESYPNPFTDGLAIRYRVLQPGLVRLTVYDLFGRVISRPVDGQRAVGEFTERLDSMSLPAGIYFVRLETRDGTRTATAVKIGAD